MINQSSKQKVKLKSKFKTHEEQKYHKCNLCDKAFFIFKTITDTSVHEWIKVQISDLCDKPFSVLLIGSLKKHMENVHKGMKNQNW